MTCLVLWLLLQAYKAKDRTKYFYVEHWVTLLESTGILGNPHMGEWRNPCQKSQQTKHFSKSMYLTTHTCVSSGVLFRSHSTNTQ